MSDSKELNARARELIPGGVNSPVRSCRSVGAEPLFIRQGYGSKIVTEEGREMIDFVLSWGPLLLGHAHPEVLRAAREALDKGSSFGAPCTGELDLAELIIDALPGVEMVRLVNSGTEASMSAIRAARAYTGRNKILKFEGNYHGHVDSLLARAGSGVATLSIPGTPGVPEDTVKDTLIAPYNDPQAVRDIFAEHGGEIAAVILEPVAGNMGTVVPDREFLTELRRICSEQGSQLIFDEVITGFRVAYSGAQGYFGVTPDLTCLGKIIGGGFPVGAIGGHREVMEMFAPCGSVYQAGTLAGNPVAMAAGAATLRTLAGMDYADLEQRTREFATKLQQILQPQAGPVQLNCIGSLFTLFFTPDPVTDFASAQKTDTALYGAFYRQMREQNIYLSPANFECTFTSFAHTDEDLETALQAARKVSL
ncbi:MAG: glutamate-1-semialdehyde 2,1-aminomutase [Desulfohalobiaceae bacterium]|nr:glutamate-1-semialdehyde 2,1-aminomutase [Desulfohalobiaceae bacterium]